MASTSPIQLPSKKKKIIFSTLGLIVLLAAVATVLEVTNTTHFFHKAPSPVSKIIGNPDTMGGNTGNNQKGEPVNGTTSPNSSSATQPGDIKSNDGGSTSTSLLTPSGDFVSNHHPNLSGSPAPATVTSVCTTTPGASCVITFTKNGVTKSLSTETTDRGGSAYWNDWSLQSVGLTVGSWQVKAVATLGGQTKTAIDAMDLVVSQ